MGNDTDPDKVYGDTLTVHSVSGATNGAVVLNTNGTVTFTPTANYQGPASFTYQVKDTKGAVSANTATVNLNVLAVNDAPTAVADGPFGASEDTARTFTAAQLVGNDTDPDKVYGDTLTVHRWATPPTAPWCSTPTTTVSFTPTANYQGPASFTYQVKDTKGAVSANTATVNLNVLAVNDAPTAVADGPLAPVRTPGAFTAAQLVGNDTDPDKVYGDTLSVHSVGGATNGAVVLNTNGTVTFTPPPTTRGRRRLPTRSKTPKERSAPTPPPSTCMCWRSTTHPPRWLMGRLAPARTPRARLLPRSWCRRAITPIPTRSMATP